MKNLKIIPFKELKVYEIYLAQSVEGTVVARVTYSEIESTGTWEHQWAVQGKVISSNFYKSTYHNIHEDDNIQVSRINRKDFPEFWL